MMGIYMELDQAWVPLNARFNLSSSNRVEDVPHLIPESIYFVMTSILKIIGRIFLSGAVTSA